MKKTYINPQIQVVVMKMNQQMLAGSPTGVNDTTGNGTQLSREFDFDFDDEFDE